MSHYDHQLQRQKGVVRFSLVEILSILYIGHKLLPAVGYYMPSIVYLGVFALTTILLLPMFRYKPTWMLFGFFSVSLLTLLARLNSVSTSMLYLYGELQLYLYGLIAIRLVLFMDKKTCRRMFGIIVAMYAFTAITTIIGNENYPQASRMMATLSSSDPLYRNYVQENIGSFAFVYEMVLLTPLLIYLTRNKILKPILGYGLIILIGFMIFVTEYGMAVMLFVPSLLLLVLPKLTTRRLIVLLVVVLLVLMLCTGLIADLFEQLSLNVESETLAERFLIVAQTLRGDAELAEGTGASRIDLYNRSLNSFMNTDFMGRWGTGGIGGHSFVFDAMGNFGLLGLAGAVLIFFTVYKLCLKPYQDQPYHPYMVWTCLVGVLLMIMNPKTYPFIFLCVLPLFAVAFKTENEERGT